MNKYLKLLLIFILGGIVTLTIFLIINSKNSLLNKFVIGFPSLLLLAYFLSDQDTVDFVDDTLYVVITYCISLILAWILINKVRVSAKIAITICILVWLVLQLGKGLVKQNTQPEASNEKTAEEFLSFV